MIGQTENILAPLHGHKNIKRTLSIKPIPTNQEDILLCAIIKPLLMGHNS